MKKYLVLFFITILLFIFDMAIAPFINIKGYYPSLLVLFVISYSIIYGSIPGLWLGVFAGLLQDVFFTSAFGINSFSNMLVGCIAGIIGNSILKERSIIPVISSFALCIFKMSLVSMLLFVLGLKFNYRGILYSSLYNLPFSFFIYRFTYRLSNKEYMKKVWKFKER